MFRRRNRDQPGTAAEAEGDEEFEELLDEDEDVEPEADDVADEPEYDRSDGPWDISEVDDAAEGRVDLGCILVPAVENMQVRMNVAENRILNATVLLGETALELLAFAAPKTEGIWAEVRGEIAAEVTRQGGIVDEAEGPFGAELRAQVPALTPDGRQGIQRVRFIGVDGPRWFLRGVISGRGAVALETAAGVEDVFRRVIVNRGSEAMAPHDPIPFKPPVEMQQAPEQPASPARNPYSNGLNPFDRGPEITEVR